MSDEGTKVTIRMGADEIQKVEDFMADFDIGNRSDFIRDAISGYIALKRGYVPDAGSESGLFVRFSEVQLATLGMLKEDGICLSEEEFVRKCVLDRLITEESEKDSVQRSLKAAQMAHRMK